MPRIPPNLFSGSVYVWLSLGNIFFPKICLCSARFKLNFVVARYWYWHDTGQPTVFKVSGYSIFSIDRDEKNKSKCCLF